MPLRQARSLVPSMFIEHDPQMPSRHDRRKVSVGSISFLILISASSTIGPQVASLDPIGVHARVLPVVGVPAVDAELLPPAPRLRLVPGLPGLDPGIAGKREFDHAQPLSMFAVGCSFSVSRRALVSTDAAPRGAAGGLTRRDVGRECNLGVGVACRRRLGTLGERPPPMPGRDRWCRNRRSPARPCRVRR